MPNYLESDLNDAGTFQNLPIGIYNMHITAVDLKPSQAGAPMATLDWTIDEGEYKDKKLRFDTVMLGGISKAGKPLSLGKMCALIHYAGLPWQCNPQRGGCGANHSGTHSFLIARKEDHDANPALTVGNYYCPACKNPKPSIRWDTDVLMGARCGGRIGPKKKEEGTTSVFDEIKGYTDLVGG